MFNEHNTDAVNFHMGPSGWHLGIQSPELMKELCVTKGRDVFPKWPGVLSSQDVFWRIVYCQVFIMKVAFMLDLTTPAYPIKDKFEEQAYSFVVVLWLGSWYIRFGIALWLILFSSCDVNALFFAPDLHKETTGSMKNRIVICRQHGAYDLA